MTRRLLCALRRCLAQAGLWRQDASLAAAVSGGGDSMALLCALSLLRQEMPFRLTACHVQHGLRGEESLNDQRLVEETCQKLGIPCVVDDAALHGDMHTPGMETLARDRRRQIFLSRMESLPADALLTAHHQGDQSETLLMHLLRGSGLRGLGGMRKMQSFGNGLLLRPLLDFTKDELVHWLTEQGFAFAHDRSNDEAITPRNALRLDVMPRLEELWPDAGRHMAQAAKTLQQDEDCLSLLADELYKASLWQYSGLMALRTEPLLHAHDALCLRALRRLYREGAAFCGITLSEAELSRQESQHASALLHGEPGQTLNLPENLLLYRGRRLIYLLRQGELPLRQFAPPSPLPLKDAEGEIHFGPMSFSLGPAIPGEPFGPYAAWLTPAQLEETVLRFPAPGDFIHPMGASGKKPLRRFLTDRHIDRPLRPFLPMLFRGSEALWIPGLCCAQSLRQQDCRGLTVIRISNPQESCILYTDKE